ncbi:MAG: ABC transporter permease [Candidatus Kerfeldbacteria bacterium]|nr:ABC transporter permease [Candidatus Kerfeldbacteria bacterium]
MVTLGRMIVFGVQTFWRNIWLSLVTVLIVTLNLFLMSVVLGLNVVGQQTLTAVKERVNLSVYFTATTSEDRVETVRQELLARPEVESVDLISRAERLELLRRSQGQSNLINAAIEALGENPLGAGLIVTAKTLDGYNAIARFLQSDRYETIIEDTGREFETNQTVINRLTLIVGRIQGASLWLTLLFGLIAVLMVFNAIRVTIYAHREEIGIMKLVGASDAFVRGPFVVTSLLYGLLASLFTTIIFVPILTITNPFFSQFFAGYDVNILGYVQQHLWQILGLEVVVGCGLSVLSSLFAIGRYLRV